MPLFSLDQHLAFPHPVLREPDGLVAVGGDLSPERLLLAYAWGIFPWYTEEYPVLWWWTSPRLMVRPNAVHISHSMRTMLRNHPYTITFNQRFRDVMEKCGTHKRRDQSGTWIIPEMIDAYVELHRMGFAHSVEVMHQDELIGGLYGIKLGKIFSGESMFAAKPNASKIAFITFCRQLETEGIQWIDCQQDTPHMRSLGGQLLSEEEFLNVLRENQKALLKGPGGNINPFFTPNP